VFVFRIPIEIPELEALMASVQELQTNVNNLSDKVDAMRTRISDDVQALRDEIASQQLDQDAVNAITARVDAITATVDSIDPDPNNPPPAR
jgi:uncharacterized protein YoxC